MKREALEEKVRIESNKKQSVYNQRYYERRRDLILERQKKRYQLKKNIKKSP